MAATQEWQRFVDAYEKAPTNTELVRLTAKRYHGECGRVSSLVAFLNQTRQTWEVQDVAFNAWLSAAVESGADVLTEASANYEALECSTLGHDELETEGT